jgi:formylglycine-generating enzyme required for sulfatase activity
MTGLSELALIFGLSSAPAPARALIGQEATHGARTLTLSAPGPAMVRVPEGRFVLGSSPEEVLRAAASCALEPLGHRCSEQTFANELGRRLAHLPSFWIDRTEVTVREYARCVAHGRCTSPTFAAGALRFAEPDNPVTFVGFADAENYCRFRGLRLPSELMFERAARGNSGRIYPWGDLYNPRIANHGRFALVREDASDGYAELAPAGAYAAGRTPDGILDLAGNVAEWTSDPYRERYDDPMPSHSATSRRVVRGGSFMTGAAWLRGAARQGFSPETRRPDLGFRCALGRTDRERPPP